MTDDQLFECMCKGIPAAQIADLFGLHRATISLRIRQLRKKLSDEENTGV